MTPHNPDTTNPGWPVRERAAQVWAMAPLVTSDKTVHAWLRLNHISADKTAARDLARALPPTDFISPVSLGLRSAHFDPTSDRLLVQLFAVDGRLATLHAESVIPGRRKVAEGTTPPPVSRRGLVLANRTARMLLALPLPANAGWLPRIAVTESVSRFLRAATATPAGGRQPPMAVIGLLPGSWSSVVAERIPSGSRVTVVPSDDPASAFTRITHDLSSRCTVRIVDPGSPI